MQREKLEKRLKLFRAIADDHAAGEAKRHMERAVEEIEAQLKKLDAEKPKK